MLNTVLFSDSHLGSPMSRAYALLNTLKEYRFKQLIIAGDLFEDIRFNNLTSTHWQLLEHIGKLSRRNVRVIWLEGNHDVRFYRSMAKMIGIPACREYIWEINGTRFLAIHGHQFDNFLMKNNLFGGMLARFYSSFQRIFASQVFDLLYNKLSDKWLRGSEQIAKKAIEYAKRKKCDVAICGHTHLVKKLSEGGVRYYNLGCWNNVPSYILKISDNADIDLAVIT